MKLVNIYLFIDFSKNCNDLKSLIYILIFQFRTYYLYFYTHNATQYKNIFNIMIKKDLDIIRIKRSRLRCLFSHISTYFCNALILMRYFNLNNYKVY